MAKKKTVAQLEKAKARARQRYAEDADYRERKVAETNAHYALHRDELNAKQRHRYATDSDFREMKLANGRTNRRKGNIEKHGISIEDYERVLAGQNGRCLICQREFPRTPCLDHDHGTGELRGLLCDRCNLGIGHYKDNPVWLRRAADHVEKGQQSAADSHGQSRLHGTEQPSVGDDGGGQLIRRAFLLELRRPPGPNQPQPVNRLQQIVRMLVDKAGASDMAAIREVLARIAGRRRFEHTRCMRWVGTNPWRFKTMQLLL